MKMLHNAAFHHHIPALLSDRPQLPGRWKLAATGEDAHIYSSESNSSSERWRDNYLRDNTILWLLVIQIDETFLAV